MKWGHERGVSGGMGGCEGWHERGERVVCEG